MDPLVSFGTVDEILTTSRILVTEHQFQLLRFPSSTSVESAEVKITEMGLEQVTNLANLTQEGREKRKWNRRQSRQMRKIKMRGMDSEQEQVINLANMTKEGRDWIRHDYWRQKVVISQLKDFYIL